MISDVYIGLGSNLQDPHKQICLAVEQLATLADTRVIRCSSLYRSVPVGPPGQPDYLNAAAQLETALPPQPLLRALQSIEQAQGRRRGIRWGPRVIDLDILLYASMSNHDPELTIPHPELTNRLFVLLPLLEIAPDLSMPDGQQLASLVSSCAGDTPIKLSHLTICRGGTVE